MIDTLFDVILTAVILLVGACVVMGLATIALYLASNLLRREHLKRIMDAGPPKISRFQAKLGTIGEIVAGLDDTTGVHDRELQELKQHVERLAAQQNQLAGAVLALSGQLTPAGGGRYDAAD